MSRKDALQEPVYPSEPHARVKHTLYRRYINCWLPKILQSPHFPRAVVVDGFSAAGYYTDGLDGSPVLFARSFLEHRASPRFKPLRLVTLDAREDRTVLLREKLAQLPDDPRLTFDVREPGHFAEQLAKIARDHSGERVPFLWILDPYGLRDTPWDTVAACTAERGHEVIITVMVHEMHRFKTAAGMQQTMTTVFGDNSWTEALEVEEEGASKDALLDIYRRRLATLGLETGRFDIQVRNSTPRYSLIFATHHKAGLACWNRAVWSIDPNRGSGAGVQLELAMGPDLSILRKRLLERAGSEVTFHALRNAALRVGCTDSHLRSVLDELLDQGLATRVRPLEARAAWPEDCVVLLFEEHAELPIADSDDQA